MLLIVSGCASDRPPIDPTRDYHVFPIVESDARSFKKLAIAVSPPHFYVSHVAGSPSSSRYPFPALAASVPPPVAALSALFFLIANQQQTSAINSGVDTDSQFMRVDQFVKPIAASSSNTLAKALESKGYSVSVVDGVPAVERGDGQTADGYRTQYRERIKELLKINDAVLTVRYNYEFVKVGNTQSYVPYVGASFDLFRRLDAGRLLQYASGARSRSRVDASDGLASGPTFERSDFVDRQGKSAGAIRDALQSEFDTANGIFLSEFSVSDE
jgi:hypothetical protein